MDEFSDVVDSRSLGLVVSSGDKVFNLLLVSLECRVNMFYVKSRGALELWKD